jgi:hypothetical protein
MRQEHPLWSPGTRRSGHPEGARLRLFALRATTELGEAIASALGWPLSAHEERQFEDGEHKTRPLETVGGMDVYVMQSLHGGPSESANDKIGRLLFFIARSRTPGRRSWCRPSGQTSIAFTSGRPGALAGTRPSSKRSASWICLAHGAENFAWFVPLAPRAFRAWGRHLRHTRTLLFGYIPCQGHRDSE